MIAAEDRALRQVLEDVEEVVVALTVAGVAFVDPDLPDTLATLEDRARRAGLGGAGDRLRALAVPVAELAATTQPARRRALAQRGFDALQSLVAWTRVFKAGLTLEIVKGRLDRATADAPVALRRGEDLEVWPVGAEQAGKRFLVHALAGDGRWVVLADELGEIDDDAPLHVPAVSRLFQDRLALVDVLGGRVQLTDHPLTRSGHRTVARAVFHTRPRVKARGEGPQVPEVPRVGDRPGPLRMSLRVDRSGADWRFSGVAGPVEVAVEPAFDRALRRRAAWHGAPLELSLVGVARGAGLAVLAWRDALGEPGWPTLDPAAVRWPAEAFAERLGDGLEAVLARRALHLAGTGVADPADPPAPEDLEGAFRVAVLATLGGAPVDPVAAAAVFVERGARGEDTFNLLWPAVWLVLAAAPQPDLEPSLVALRDARRATPLRAEDDWDEICLRARLIAHLEHDDDGSAPAAVAFVEAHLSSLRRQVDEGRVPDPLTLWAIADTRARVRGEPGGPGVLRTLGLPLDVLRDAVDRPLCAWLEGGEPPTWTEVDALIAAAGAGLGPQLWTA